MQFPIEDDSEEPFVRNAETLQQFNVDSGVDDAILITNLLLLRNVLNSLKTNESNYKADAYFVACVLAGWFSAFGVTQTRLEKWLQMTNPAGLMKNVEQELNRENDLYKRIIEVYFPSVIDVRLRYTKTTIHLFGHSVEESVYTYNVFTLSCKFELTHIYSNYCHYFKYWELLNQP
jgi:hypothetical protein